MHILGIKWHAKFSPCSVFSSIRVPQKHKQKNNSVWSTYARKKCNLLHIYGVLWTYKIQGTSNRHHFFLQNVSYFCSPLKMENSKKQEQKTLQKKIGCWHNCLWFSIVFHCSFFGCPLVFLWFSLVFLDLFKGFSLLLNNFHVLFFAYHFFCSLVFICFLLFFFIPECKAKGSRL